MRPNLPNTQESPVVIVVDDDASVLRALRRLIASAGYQVRTYAAPRELLATEIPTRNACLILDVNLPEMNGVELRAAIANAGRDLPTIMITGRSDLHTRSLLERTRCTAVLFKPFDDTTLIEAICRAIAESQGTRS